MAIQIGVGNLGGVCFALPFLILWYHADKSSRLGYGIQFLPWI